MREYIPDNYDQWEARDRELCRSDGITEKCAWCGEPLGDTYYQKEDDHICETCWDGYEKECRRYA